MKSVSEIARSANAYFIVDASQSAGVVPIDVRNDDIDVLAFAGHKSLYGIPGIGGLYLREDLRPESLKVGGTGVRSDLLYQPEEIPMFYEAGTQNMPGIIALNAGVDYVLRTGIDQIREATGSRNGGTEMKP
ncbi:MAG: aminotransferase class V-fold PLP-dependent enzyme [Sedimentisphaerales bacterium]|nr:aminotransferase class V-fold PLP-dependent enzyme [Sedimentisphaerales bacterium]